MRQKGKRTKKHWLNVQCKNCRWYDGYGDTCTNIEENEEADIDFIFECKKWEKEE